MLATANSGATWTTVVLPAGAPGLGSVACPTATSCVAVGDGIYVTIDGGQTWQQRTIPGGIPTLRSVVCPTATRCVAVGPNASGNNDPTAAADVVASGDGGATWNLISAPKGSAATFQISCDTTAECFAVGPTMQPGGAATFLVTPDAGKSWVNAPAPPGLNAVADLSCPAVHRCVAVGAQQTGPATAVTTDGSTWAVQPETLQVGVGP